MNNYEFYVTAKEICQYRAQQYSEADNLPMTVFYMNAAKGFQQKADKLQLNKIGGIFETY